MEAHMAGKIGVDDIKRMKPGKIIWDQGRGAVSGFGGRSGGNCRLYRGVGSPHPEKRPSPAARFWAIVAQRRNSCPRRNSPEQEN